MASKVIPISMDVLRDAGYRLDPQMTLAIKAMTQAEAITQALVPEWTGAEFMQRSVDATLELLPDVLTPEAVKIAVVKQTSYVVRETAQQLPSLESGAMKWLENLKRGGLRVELDTSALDRQVSQLRGIAMMVTLEILIVGLIIGSAIAAGVGGLEGSPLASMTSFAILIFAGASAIGAVTVLYLVWVLVRRDRRKRGVFDRM